jgi:glutathione S-transferase
MVLYLKAAADGTSVGDCPFAHYVRMVLEEKNLEYEIRPTVQETKPSWLIEHYGGKLPALRHRKECYVESDVICEYLDFFFQNPSLTVSSKAVKAKAEAAVDGLFPAVAKYLKHTPDGDDDDQILQNSLETTLSKLNNHLQETGPFLCGEEFSLMDCALAPKLYHMKTGVSFFKDSSITLDTKFPEIYNYMQTVFSRKSFVDTKYPEEVIVWGWGNARK